MDVFKKLGVPVDEIELGLKILIQTAIVVVGVVGNVYTICSVLARSKLPRATNTFIISLSVALILQACTAGIDYADHLRNAEDYSWGIAVCDTWHTLNVYLPMLLSLHCFCCLLDRLVVLTRPHLHPRIMHPWTVTAMLLVTYLLPVLVTVPPIYFEWYTTDAHIKWRTDKQCKFKTNMTYAMISPLFTFWLPLGLVAFVIVKMFRAMERQDRAVAGGSCEKLPVEDRVPWQEGEMRRQHRLAITLWSVYWNVTLFWIPQHAWLFIYKVTDADWPRATNFMVWAGYLPCLILPALYRYYNIYQL